MDSEAYNKIPPHVRYVMELGDNLSGIVGHLNVDLCKDFCAFHRLDITQALYVSTVALAANIRYILMAARESGAVKPEAFALIQETLVNMILERKADNG